MLRQERQTVAMELAAALHHSRDWRPNETYVAPRGQGTASSGTRPSEPHVWDAAASHVAAQSPSLVVPGLAADEPLDSVTLNFLLHKRFETKKLEEQEEEDMGETKMWQAEW